LSMESLEKFSGWHFVLYSIYEVSTYYCLFSHHSR
jgi:hypothetical protein